MKNALPFLILIHLALLPVAASAEANDNGASPSSLAKCLPPDIKLSDVVEAGRAREVNGRPAGSSPVTVEQKLHGLGATCNSANRLVDGTGKEIVFYHLTGCWGNPPADYQEILQKQREEIARLKQQKTVIEMTCNPSGTSLRSIMGAQ